MKKFTTTVLITSILLASCSGLPSLSVESSPINGICIENFELTIGSNRRLSATIPPDCLENKLQLGQKLQSKQGRVKDTSFNKVDVTNLKGMFIDGGYKLQGDWRLQHREFLLRDIFTNRNHYTPWTNDIGTFYQEYQIKIENGNIVVNPGDHGFTKDSQGFLRDLLGDYLVYGEGNFRDKFADDIKNGLQELQGKTVTQILIDANVPKNIASKIPVSEEQVITFLNSGTGKLNAQMSSRGLDISLGF
jgi:hypothetical protein